MFLIPRGTTIEQKSITAATLIFSNTLSVNVMFRRRNKKYFIKPIKYPCGFIISYNEVITRIIIHNTY